LCWDILFCLTLYKTAEKVLGYQQKQQRAPWITKEVLELSGERKRLKAMINKSKENRAKYNKVTRKIKKIW